MSANINLDKVLSPFVIVANVGVNSLTQLYYSRLNPEWNAAKKTSYAATFHYNVKVTLHNLTTAYLAFLVAKTLAGKGSYGSLAATIAALFIKTVLEKTLSIQDSGKKLLKGAVSQLSEKASLEGTSVTDNTYATFCVSVSKLRSKARKPSWKEDFLVIRGYPVLKNWAPI